MSDRQGPASARQAEERLWVKICGLTTVSDVRAAIDAGADALGFVFAPSKRQITPAQAARLASRVPGTVARVAVMLHPTQACLDEVLAIFRPDLLQTDLADLDVLQLPAGLGVLPVVRSNLTPPLPLPQRLLYEGARSGTGERTDWTSAARVSQATRLVLAGGLDPENIAAAIALVRPAGVDVSSGVELAPGIKDAGKIHAFVRRARAARSGAEG